MRRRRSGSPTKVSSACIIAFPLDYFEVSQWRAIRADQN
jgi:hypothetical protein